MGRKLKLRLALFVAVLLLVAVGIGCWYFGYYRKTPDYAIRMVERSLDEHDKALFHRYVDADQMLVSSYDGFMEGVVDVETAIPDEAKPAIGSFTQIMKNPIIASFKEALDRYVETGSWAEGDAAEDTDIAPELLARSGLQNVEYRGVDEISDPDGDSTVASVLVYQKEAAREFTLEAVLQRGENGDWKVVGLRNLGDFIKTRAKPSSISTSTPRPPSWSATTGSSARPR